MSKYEPLWKAIGGRAEDSFTLTYAEIEQILGFPIDHAFLTFKKELPAYGYEVGKISMKEQQKRNAARRGSWYGLNPVTRKPENSKAYNRRKAQKWSDDSGSVPFVISVRRSSEAVFFDYSPADFERLIKPWRFLRGTTK